MIVALEWFSVSLTCLSTVLLGDKKRLGWAVAVLGNVCWIAWAVMIDAVGVVFVNLLLAALGIRNWLGWK